MKKLFLLGVSLFLSNAIFSQNDTNNANEPIMNAFDFSGGGVCDSFAINVDSVVGTDCSTYAVFSMSGTFPMSVQTFWPTGGGSVLTANSSPYTITNFCPESYTVVITDANGCTDSLFFTVGAIDTCAGFSVSLDTLMGVGCNTVATFNLTGAFPMTLQTYWSTGSGGLLTADSTGYVIPGFCPETYNVVVTDDNGCVDSVGFSVYLAGLGAQLNNDERITIYPNPATQTINVDFGIMPIDAAISVYSLDGRVLKQYQNIQQNIYTIPVADLPAGLYYLRIFADKQATVKRFVKE